MAVKYIEAQPGEKWRDVAALFRKWLQLNVQSLESFGYAEDDPVEHNGRRFIALDIPARHGEGGALFEAWARTTGRVHGTQESE